MKTRRKHNQYIGLGLAILMIISTVVGDGRGVIINAQSVELTSKNVYSILRQGQTLKDAQINGKMMLPVKPDYDILAKTSKSEDCVWTQDENDKSIKKQNLSNQYGIAYDKISVAPGENYTFSLHDGKFDYKDENNEVIDEIDIFFTKSGVVQQNNCYYFQSSNNYYNVTVPDGCDSMYLSMNTRIFINDYDGDYSKWSLANHIFAFNNVQFPDLTKNQVDYHNSDISVNGSFEWQEPNKIMDEPGVSNQMATFIPSDNAYESQSVSVPVKVVGSDYDVQYKLDSECFAGQKLNECQITGSAREVCENVLYGVTPMSGYYWYGYGDSKVEKQAQSDCLCYDPVPVKPGEEYSIFNNCMVPTDGAVYVDVIFAKDDTNIGGASTDMYVPSCCKPYSFTIPDGTTKMYITIYFYKGDNCNIANSMFMVKGDAKKAFDYGTCPYSPENVTGTLSWKDGDKSMSAGTSKETIIFTPTNSNLNPKEINVDVNTIPKKQSKVYHNEVSIDYGTKLRDVPINEKAFIQCNNLIDYSKPVFQGIGWQAGDNLKYDDIQKSGYVSSDCYYSFGRIKLDPTKTYRLRITPNDPTIDSSYLIHWLEVNSDSIGTEEYLEPKDIIECNQKANKENNYELEIKPQKDNMFLTVEKFYGDNKPVSVQLVEEGQTFTDEDCSQQVPGTFQWEKPEEVLSAGKHTVYAEFNPDNGRVYDKTKIPFQVTVNQVPIPKEPKNLVFDVPVGTDLINYTLPADSDFTYRITKLPDVGNCPELGEYPIRIEYSHKSGNYLTGEVDATLRVIKVKQDVCWPNIALSLQLGNSLSKLGMSTKATDQSGNIIGTYQWVLGEKYTPSKAGTYKINLRYRPTDSMHCQEQTKVYTVVVKKKVVINPPKTKKPSPNEKLIRSFSLSKIKSFKVKKKKNRAIITWKKDKKAQKYQVFVRKGKGKWKVLKLTSKCKISFSMKKKVKYQFRVRAQRKIGKKNYYGKYSASKKCYRKK